MSLDPSNFPAPNERSAFHGLHTHLLEVLTSDQSAIVKSNVLDDALFAATYLKDEDLDAAIPSTAPLLATILALGRTDGKEDFENAIGILDRIMGRDSVSLETIINHVSPNAFQLLLSSPSNKAIQFAIKILKKGVDSENGADWLAEQDLMLQMVQIWLRGDTEISVPMGELLLRYLEADAPRGHKVNGKLWKQLLESRDVYLYILQVCSWKSLGLDGIRVEDLLNSTRTTCQSRLLSLLAKLCRANYPALTKKSMWPDLHENFDSSDEKGILGYAINLIDRTDKLAFVSLIDSATEALENASQDKPRKKDPEDPQNTKVLVALSELLNSPEIHLTEDIFSTYLSSSEYTAPLNEVVATDAVTESAVRFITTYANCFVGGFAQDHWFSNMDGTKLKARVDDDSEEFCHEGTMLNFILPVLLGKLDNLNKRISKPTLLMLTGLPIQYFLPVAKDNRSSMTKPYEGSIISALSITSPDPNQSRALAYFFNPPSAPMLGRVYYAMWMESQRLLHNVHDPLNLYRVIHRRAGDASNIESCFASIELFKSILLAEGWSTQGETPKWLRPGFIDETLRALRMERLPESGMKELLNLKSPLEDMIRLPNVEGHAPYHIRPRDPITSSDPDVVKMLKARYSLVELIDAVLWKHHQSDRLFRYFDTLCKERLTRGVEGLDNGVARRPYNDVQAVAFS
ncbi:hypothetical protein BJ508DRAFT_90451 [Ascobolus immersus RN42]|uniref:Uncharacterized protein n=1 Tax=Ascobolus immersus RN42 TaxID=1160509 RepID=A0A3N4I892_ASCIM|nr:hypothetical protein BJ508DRAFT_90451 [Ascobolus immersus RN42]